ncbi:Hypothetical_protein [Hexamita inflata]|uniref:Hypothetical_protein n=1 Tax=Hexamita inflata TaxID=28002 RepID=A0AA86R666_9EUKA|nr:Hypothetical protein HINF_LOCUS59826 [Hexamita inflata]
MNILIYDPDQAATEMTIQNDDVIWRGQRPEPSLLFDSIVMRVSTTQAVSQIHTLVSGVYEPQAKESEVMKQQMQMFQLSRMDDNCNEREKQKPPPYCVLLFSQSKTELYVTILKLKQLKNASNIICAFEQNEIREDTVQFALALARLQQLEVIEPVKTFQTLQLYTQKYEKQLNINRRFFDETVFCRFAKNSKSQHKLSTALDQIIIQPDPAFDLSQLEIQTLKIDCIEQAEYVSQAVCYVAFAPPLIVVLDKNKNAYQVAGVAKMRCTSIQGNTITLNQVAGRGLTYSNITLKIAHPERLQRYQCRLNKTISDQVRIALQKHLRQQTNFVLSYHQAADVLSKHLNIQETTRYGICFLDKKIQFQSRSDMRADFNLDAANVYVSDFLLATNEVISLLYIKNNDGEIEDFLLLNDGSDFRRMDLLPAEINSIMDIFTEQMSELTGIDANFFKQILFSIPYEKQITLENMSQVQAQKLLKLCLLNRNVQKITVQNQFLTSQTTTALSKAIARSSSLLQFELQNSTIESNLDLAQLYNSFLFLNSDLQIKINELNLSTMNGQNTIYLQNELKNKFKAEIQMNGTELFDSNMQLAKALVFKYQAIREIKNTEFKLMIALNQYLKEVKE